MTILQTECLSVIEMSPIAELTTIDASGYPSTRAMLNLRNRQQYPTLIPLFEQESNPLTIYMTTNTGSEKIKEIEQNSKACLYFYNPQTFKGVLLQGIIEHVTDKDFKQKVWQKGWEMYYPKGESDYSVLRFAPNKIKTYENFGVTTEEIK